MTSTTVFKSTLPFLVETTSDPSITFTFRIHSGSEKQLHDHGHIRGRCHEVFKQFDFDPSVIQSLREKTDQLIEEIDLHGGAKSIGLFVSDQIAHCSTFFVNIPERHYCGKFFSGLESLYAAAQSAPYALFLLEPHDLRVYKGQFNHLDSLPHQSAALSHLQKVFKDRPPAEHDKDGKIRRGQDSKWQKDFLDALSSLCKQEQLPAMIVGLDLVDLTEREIKESGVEVVAIRPDVHQFDGSEGLSRLVESLLKDFHDARTAELLERCTSLLASQKLISNQDDMHTCAQEGRAELLILETPSWNISGKMELTKLHETILHTLTNRGSVEFVPIGSLSKWSGAVMILRY